MNRLSRPLATFLACLPVALAACGGGSDDASFPEIRSVTAERVTDAEGRQGARVIVRMDRDFTLARGNVPLASRIELDVPDPISGGTRRALPATAEVPADEPRAIVITLDTLVPDGTRVRIDKRAFNRDAEGELVATVSSDLTPALALLATREFIALLESLYDAPVPAEVTDAGNDPEAMREALEEHLETRGASEDVATRALAQYDAISPEIVPAPRLRAALAALTGTFAEPAVNDLLTGENCTGQPAALIAFQEPPEFPELLARATLTEDGRRVISINPVSEGDRIEHLMALLAHEAIHCDNQDSRAEEVAATAFDAFLYMQLLAVDPELARVRTPLARELNIDVVALINSGRAVPESIGVLKSPGVTRALPGTSSEVQSFGDLVVAAYEGLARNTSADEPLANAYAANLARAAGIGPRSAFDLAFLDEVLGKALPIEVLEAGLAAFEMQPVS